MSAPPRLGSRAGFGRLVARAYLAHAAIAPLSAAVSGELARLAALAESGGLAAFPDLLAGAELARARFAALIGAEPRDVAVLPNTSGAAAAIAGALPWRAGERILVFRGEFPANVLPWRAAARRFGLELVELPLEPFERDQAEGLAACDAALAAGGVRLVAVSAVQFQTGLRMPVAELGRRARAAGARLFVDAIQAVGSQPVDVTAWGADYLAAGGHKWLMGPLGSAYLWVRPEAAVELEPLLTGWTSVVDGDAFLFAGPEHLRYDRPLVPGARRFETGVLPFALLGAGALGMQALLELGPANIAAHLQAWHDRIEPALLELGFRSRRHPEAPGRSGILAAEPPAGSDPQALVRALAERGVVATAPCGLLRLAPHWPNALAECDELPAALRAALAE